MNIKDLLLGLAIGDAFGAGVEFQDRNWIRQHVDFSVFVNVRDQITVAPEQKQLFTKNYTAWDYTDDTEMTIGVLKALMSNAPFSKTLLIQKWEEEYNKGLAEKGYGRNGHGSMSWYFSGEKTIEEIQNFQRSRHNPGNAPAMRSVPLGLIDRNLINSYATINANATHPNAAAIISSQCIAWATEFLVVQKGNPSKVIDYCLEQIEPNLEYQTYLKQVNLLVNYDKLNHADFAVLCGHQPIQKPYFLDGICGVPSDSKYTAGTVLYILKHSTSPMDALKKSIYIGGDVDSIASISVGILSSLFGLDSLPPFMLGNIEGRKYLEEIAQQFEASLS
ncbi:MAG: ADP-ribosylglycohydrolase family protein [Aureispira sp.]|nr:ADP-ribosylglycohydrolase family protein [Aureispira sp.]